MSIAYRSDDVLVWQGDCIELMRSLPDECLDAVVTDPPYNLSFMGKHWDNIDGSFQHWCEEWARECLRLLKPGGHLLAFGGTRTWHRLTSGIEDAGFEIRDSIAWLYGSGFPKSLNLKDEWAGWGTALKPAFEPIVVARKPIIGAVAANVLAHGTGALNIDGTRIGHASEADLAESEAKNRHADFGSGPRENQVYGVDNRARGENGNYSGAAGRWPANVMLDESQAATLDEQSGYQKTGRAGAGSNGFRSEYVGGSKSREGFEQEPAETGGGASRFFYVAKASKRERPQVEGTNAHPTVKPLALMQQLVRLVTPLGGTVLDPFAGSGTTVEACLREGLRCMAMERETDYLPLILHRIHRHEKEPRP